MINTIRKSLVLIGATLLSASMAAATEYPRMEGYLGYNMVRFYPNSPFVPDFNAEGGNAQFVYNFSHWVGGVFDVGAVNKDSLNHTSVTSRIESYTLGPRVTFHNHSRFQPFVQVLFGSAHSSVSTSITVTPLEVTTLPTSVVVVNPDVAFQAKISSSTNDFALLAGGGLDIKLGKHFAFRPFEADYYLTRVASLVTTNVSNRNNFRYSGGFAFFFGAK